MYSVKRMKYFELVQVCIYNKHLVSYISRWREHMYVELKMVVVNIANELIYLID